MEASKMDDFMGISSRLVDAPATAIAGGGRANLA